MAIPDNQKTVCQIVQRGLIAAAGSGAVNTVNVWTFRRTATVAPINKSGIVAAFQGGIGLAVAAALNAGWAATLTDIRFVNDALDAFVSFTETDVGAISGDRMASYVTAFLFARTGVRGRHFRSNKKLGPMSESDTTTATSDVWNAGCLTRLTAIATAWQAGFTDADGNNWVPTVLCGPPLSQVKVNPTTVVTADITNILVNHRVSTLISRKVKSVY